MAAVSNVKSRDELIRLCNERSTTERTRWQSWWRWHECSRRVREFSPVANEWDILPEDWDEVQQLRSERLQLLTARVDQPQHKSFDDTMRKVNSRLYELTGHHGFKPR